MDFSFDPALTELRQRVRDFIDQRVIPAEAAIATEDRAGKRDTLLGLQAAARTAKLWTPHLPTAHGGLGLGPMGMAALFREMGRSPFGARVFHCDAPDQGNMDLLLKAATPAQQAQYLAPLVKATITSAFAMTEPAPGAGADPTNLRTTAREDGAGWVLDGTKWFATGAKAAAFLIVVARTSVDPKAGATLFLVDRNAKGLRYVRDIEVMAAPMLDHVEGELEFTGVRVGHDAVLGGVGQGFALAQARLVPARLTHCMRWLGLATRTLESCRAYVGERMSFGKELARHQQIQALLYRNAEAIHQGNLMTLHCAWLLEQGKNKEARPYSSMAKTHVARTLCQVLDDAIQMHGAKGYSADLPFADWYRFARAARIADGPDEVHVATVARDFLLSRFEVLV